MTTFPELQAVVEAALARVNFAVPPEVAAEVVRDVVAFATTGEPLGERKAGILPCPFCNGVAKENGAEQGGYWVRCENYGGGCGVMTEPRMTSWGAREAWNRRTGARPKLAAIRAAMGEETTDG